MKKTYDSTVARIAGNILSGHKLALDEANRPQMVYEAVRTARAIVAEVQRTEPQETKVDGICERHWPLACKCLEPSEADTEPRR